MKDPEDSLSESEHLSDIGDEDDNFEDDDDCNGYYDHLF